MAGVAGMLDAMRSSLSGYEEVARVCVSKLYQTYEDLGLQDAEMVAIVQQTCDAAAGAWLNAVKHAEAKRDALQAKVHEATAEIARIKQALLGTSIGSTSSANAGGFNDNEEMVGSLHVVHEATLQRLALWRERKAARQQEYEALHTTCSALERQLGLPKSAARQDLTQAGLDFLTLELERLTTEKARCVARACDMLSQLHTMCDELGEDVGVAAGEAHPSLRSFSLSKVDLSDTAAVAAADVDLSEATFTRLVEKLEAMELLKVERNAQLQQLQDVLTSLWEATNSTGVQQEQRPAYQDLVTSATRLHAGTLDKLQAEVRRLELCRAQAMRDLTMAKARELQAACAEARMPVPELPVLLAEMGRRTGPGDTAAAPNPGQISDCLARVVRALADVASEAQRRKPLVDAIAEVEHARAEAQWLRTYEGDANRFKGRDANARLQRSIRAQRLRDALPSMLSALQQRLEDWMLVDGPFLVDGKDARELLVTVAAEVEGQQDAERARVAARTVQRQHAAQAATSKVTPAQARTAVRGATNAAGSAVGQRAVATASRIDHAGPVPKRSVQLPGESISPAPRRLSYGGVSQSMVLPRGSLANAASGSQVAGSPAQLPLSSSKQRSTSSMLRTPGASADVTSTADTLDVQTTDVLPRHPATLHEVATMAPKVSKLSDTTAAADLQDKDQDKQKPGAVVSKPPGIPAIAPSPARSRIPRPGA